METKEFLSHALGEVLKIARRVSDDVAHEVEAIFKKGVEDPLSKEELRALFTHIATTIKNRALERGDVKTAQTISEGVDKLISEVTGEKTPAVKGKSGGRMSREHTIHLIQNHNGIKPAPVIPRPWFHRKEIPMLSGYVKTSDIQLWDENVRLDIHLGQFREKHGHSPSSQELLDIMLSNLQLPGVSDGDQFAIIELSRSIANNGVKTPPIIDIDGTLLDGNRRIAACNFILNSDEFTSEQKKRAEYVFVWQLTEDATDEDRRTVVVSLNFEPSYKQDWPTYVKAKKVYEDWQAMLALEPRKPGPQRQAEMKKELSRKYALGPEATVVTRYIKMVEWADEFEDYHIEEKKKDKFSVKHRSCDYFEYFDELSKGARPGGVAYSLNQDDGFKKLTFDLLYDNKFLNWRQIRQLRYIFDNEDALQRLRLARDEKDLNRAQDLVEDAITTANLGRADKRSLGADTRIELFVKWLEELPVKAFREEIKPGNLQKLLDALMLVRKHAEAMLTLKGEDIHDVTAA